MKRRTFLETVATVATALVAPGKFACAQQASRARTLRFVPQSDLALLDPIFTSAQVTRNHGWAVYDTLFGVTADDLVKPQMAEGYTVSDDGRTYRIKLRSGLKFHNGEPVRAQDCVLSLKRWGARDGVGQTASSFVDNWGFDDDRTIKITLKQPLSVFMDLIGRGGANIPFIMPESVANTDPFKQIAETIGSGPLKFVKDEYVSGSRVVYERNADYQPRQEAPDGSAGGKVMNFDRVEWHIIPDAATAAAALQTGEVDWYEHVQTDLVPLLRRNADVTIDNVNATGYTALLRFNQINPPFNNPAIRRAVAMAVNQTDYMIANTGNDPGAYILCKSMFPCGTTLGREIGTSAMPGDLEKGKAALKAAGYAGEKVVILHPVDFATIAPLDEVTFDLLKKLGMNVEMIATDFGTVTARRTSKEPIDKGGWSILHTWGPASVMGTPIANQFIRGLGMGGFPGWPADDTIEQLTRDWLLAKTPEERNMVADNIQRRAFEMLPMIPLGQFQIRSAFNKLTGHIAAGDGAYFWNLRRT